MKAFLITGLLGGLTTFSTFSYEGFNLFLKGEIFKFFIYIIGTNLIGLLMTFFGYNLGSRL